MALIRRIGFTRFSRWGDNLGRLTVSAATHTDALDGTDELGITCAEDLVKGDRIVWIDLQGTCHEHIVDTIDRVHDDDGAPETQAICINSVNETWDDWLDDKRPSGSVAVALASILADTRWEVGTCDQGGSASRTFYHESVREGLAGIIETWGGELETLIVHDGASIVSRRVGVRAKRGNQSSAKRFTWTKDLVSVKRSVASDNPKTRVYGYGKGVETEGGGYGRRLTFGDINNGKDYVEDAEATTVWGHPDGEGGILPAVASYVNEQCEDAAQLLQETKDYLEQVKEPKVTYTASVIDLYAFGRSWEGVGVGDDVAIIDKGFSAEGVRLHGRVSQIERDLLTGDATVTFGTLTDTMADMWQSVNNALKSNSQQNALYDAAAGTSVSWLIQLQQALNAQFNAVGTYHVETFELGEIWSNVPLNPETGLPVKSTADMWAINVNGRGQRLAAGLTSDGQWDWRTFFTGGMVTADVINAGTMKADRVRAGLLTDEKGNNFWDLTSGEFSLSAGAKLGDTSVEDLFTGLDELDKTMDGIAEDGIITEAEHAAVSKIMQTVEKERVDLENEYESLYNSEYLNYQFKQVLRTQYEAVFSVNGTHAKLELRIQNVLGTTTAEELSDAMQLYEIAYSDYSDTIKTYNSAARQAKSIIEQAQAQDKVDELDDSLTQREVFNRLTNNGATQGIYLSGGLLYINATYIETGTISDRLGRNTWNLSTGKLTTNYMTANNINASGTFECGTVSNLLRIVSGAIYGYENSTQIGKIDFSAHSYNIDDPSIKYRGIQITAEGTVRISSPQISTAVSSNQSTTATICTTKDSSVTYISEIRDDGDGTISWSWKTRSINFKNGLCTYCGLD
ncbi:phage tail spike protein [Enteroscipio rubneri]|jgi:phage minor structural protein|uniref:phage tail spike protein n=1 Tax=Enteroscipio rubneri TaxID=2070686 RepID=UPI003208DF47